MRGGTGTGAGPGPAAAHAALAQRTEQLPFSGAGPGFESLAPRVNESLTALRDPRLDLADVLCQLILDIRRIIMHPDLQNHVKLSAIQTAVDELAPPPAWP